MLGGVADGRADRASQQELVRIPKTFGSGEPLGGADDANAPRATRHTRATMSLLALSLAAYAATASPACNIAPTDPQYAAYKANVSHHVPEWFRRHDSPI